MRIYGYYCEECRICVDVPTMEYTKSNCPVCKKSDNLVDLVSIQEAEAMINHYESIIKARENYSIRMDIDEFVKYVKDLLPTASEIKQRDLSVISVPLPYKSLPSISTISMEDSSPLLETEVVNIEVGYTRNRIPHFIIPIKRTV